MPFKQIEPVHVQDLHLDPRNPRLPPHVDVDDQLELVKYFDERYELDEIAESMIDKGFFAQEPLLVLRRDGSSGFTVVEGNRRLATLKLLVQPGVAEGVPRSTHWLELRAKAQPQLPNLDPAPTLVYDERDELEDYLGFRHVTGVVPWSAESKARFVTSLVKEGRTFQEAARAIGSRQDAVRRQFVTWTALEQAQQAGESVDRAQKFFGTFYRALQTKGIREYVGVPDPRTIEPTNDTPIEEGREPRVATLVQWLFGDGARVKPLFTDSRRLTDLGHILSNDDARDILEQEGDFKLALELVGSDRQTIDGALIRARSELVKANSVAFDFVGDEEIIQRARAADRVLHNVLDTLGEPSGASPATGDEQPQAGSTAGSAQEA